MPVSPFDRKHFKIPLEVSVSYLIFAETGIPESFYWEQQISEGAVAQQTIRHAK